MGCELCTLEKRTRWFYEDSEFIILECDTCHIPMIVWKYHGMNLTERKITYIKKLSEDLFGSQITFREEQRKIKDHWHIHIEGAIID